MTDDTVRPRILIIEDDADIGRLLELELAEAGFDVELHERGASGLVALRERTPDLLVLDLGLPDLAGDEIARRVRRSESLPIIVLTANDELGSKLKLLEDGADDYVVKPFHVEELVARIRVQLRPRGDAARIEVGDLVIDRMAREVRADGSEVALSPREFDLLALLAAQPGRVFPREEIERRVWGEERAPSSNSVDVHVANLRGKLRDAGSHGLIRTVRGVGYAVKSLP
jgi:DNA-binding response OmpR family regulator